MVVNFLKYLFLSLFILLFGTKEVFAGQIPLEINWPTSPTGISLEGATLAELTAYFFEWGILIGVILAFGILLYASFSYITTSGNEVKLSKAKQMLQSAFLGLLLLLGSWIMIIVLNPELTVITEVGVSSPFYDGAFRMDAFEEKDPCDYAIISYTIRGLDDKTRHTMIEVGDITTLTQRQRHDERDLSMDPFFGVACQDGGEIEEHDYEEDVRFIEARVVADNQQLTPVCNMGCAQDPGEECDSEMFIEREFNMPKYCYDYRTFYHPGDPRFPGYETTGSVKYISQKKGPIELTCLEGDVALDHEQGCALNLYAGRFAGRCGDMIGSPGIMGSSPSEGWDRNVNCMGVTVHEPGVAMPKFDLTVINDWPEGSQSPEIRIVEDGSRVGIVERGETKTFKRLPFRADLVVDVALEEGDGYALLTDSNMVGKHCDSRAELSDGKRLRCEFELIQNLEITLEKKEY